jgi:hypothetical protein
MALDLIAGFLECARNAVEDYKKARKTLPEDQARAVDVLTKMDSDWFTPEDLHYNRNIDKVTDNVCLETSEAWGPNRLPLL